MHVLLYKGQCEKYGVYSNWIAVEMLHDSALYKFMIDIDIDIGLDRCTTVLCNVLLDVVQSGPVEWTAHGEQQYQSRNNHSLAVGGRRCRQL